MAYYLDVAKVDAYGRILPYKGKMSFSSLTQARAALIRIIENKPKRILYEHTIYEGPRSAKNTAGTLYKVGGRWQWNDHKEKKYPIKEIYKNGKIKKVWM